MRTGKCFTLPTCDLSKYPNKVTVHRDSLSHGMLPLVGRHNDISTNTMWLSFHKNTDEDLTSWLSILWEKVSCRQGFDMIGTYLPTTRSFFPISSFRIDDSRVGTAESAREDIGGDKHTLPESRYDIRNKARDSGIASYKKSTTDMVYSSQAHLDIEVSHNYAAQCSRSDDLAFVKCNCTSLV